MCAQPWIAQKLETQPEPRRTAHRPRNGLQPMRDGGCIGRAPRSTVRLGFGASGRWRQMAASKERPLRACGSDYGRFCDLFTPSP